MEQLRLFVTGRISDYSVKEEQYWANWHNWKEQYWANSDNWEGAILGQFGQLGRSNVGPIGTTGKEQYWNNWDNWEGAILAQLGQLEGAIFAQLGQLEGAILAQLGQLERRNIGPIGTTGKEQYWPNWDNWEGAILDQLEQLGKLQTYSCRETDVSRLNGGSNIRGV